MTKYLNGHSDSTGGAVVLTRPDAEKIISSSVPRDRLPHGCFLTSRGIKISPFACSNTTPTAFVAATRCPPK